VLKDNAYGLGISEVSFALFKSGCRKFLVANLQEALAIKKMIKSKNYEIAVLEGFFSDSDAKIFLKNKFIPFLSTIKQIDIWKKNNGGKNFAIFLETGLNRFSLRNNELNYLINNLNGEIRLVISHLACARNNKNKRNLDQKKEFDKMCSLIEKKLKIKEKSLSSSEAIFNLDKSFLYDSVRIGSALYGFSREINDGYGLKNIVSFKAPIIKEFIARKGDYIGYGDDCILSSDRRIGILNLGLANGLYRSMSNKSYLFCKKNREIFDIPVVGRITMEYTTIDMSLVPFLKSGEFVYLFDYDHHIKDRMDNFNYEDIIPRINSSKPVPYHKEFILYSNDSKNNIIYVK
jgi:alanine racemase